ncbi:hypothetical protein ACHMW6_06210 [Pseudoduganella sp. UC29_106]|uniref:hypothetical protein n=1 Tax=Pseudoduganella sp. UC29_106 TaxID=3374553 RepID=UPI0037578BBF
MNISLLHHSLGVRPDRREPFRNHFVAGEGHHDMPDLLKLVEAGYMVRRPAPAFCGHGDEVFYVTEAGRAFALDNLPPPPKKSRYDEYLDADYGHSFATWLCIDVPQVEHRTIYLEGGKWREECRLVRTGYGDYRKPRIEGEWKPTKKEAKASYKTALKKHQDQMRAWMKPEAA